MNKPDYHKLLATAGTLYWASVMLDPDNKAPKAKMWLQKDMRRKASKLCFRLARRYGRAAEKAELEKTEKKDS